jgi:hypothetical protein
MRDRSQSAIRSIFVQQPTATTTTTQKPPFKKPGNSARPWLLWPLTFGIVRLLDVDAPAALPSHISNEHSNVAALVSERRTKRSKQEQCVNNSSSFESIEQSSMRYEPSTSSPSPSPPPIDVGRRARFELASSSILLLFASATTFVRLSLSSESCCSTLLTRCLFNSNRARSISSSLFALSLPGTTFLFKSLLLTLFLYASATAFAMSFDKPIKQPPHQHLASTRTVSQIDVAFLDDGVASLQLLVGERRPTCRRLALLLLFLLLSGFRRRRRRELQRDGGKLGIWPLTR